MLLCVWQPEDFLVWLSVTSVEQLGLLILNDTSVDIGVEQMWTCSSSLVATQLVDDGTNNAPVCLFPTWIIFLTGATNDTLHCNDDWVRAEVLNNGFKNVATTEWLLIT